ncbi:MAG TPA: TonB-dependent receptor [Vicinamibacterales bacterium]
MQRVMTVVAGVAVILFLPRIVFAQASIAGVVKDASAAVLPGVTVEASSPALIEKTRSVVTDGTGQYRITDLPPGMYAVTFSLNGFSTVKREGLVVSGSGVLPVNADLRVGALQETITVTGESPIVDTQSTRRETVIKSDTINTLPVTRGYGSLLATVPALAIGGVAGAGAASAPITPDMMFFTAHGGDSTEGRVMTNGLTLAAPFGGGGTSTFTYDVANQEEIQVLISGGLGEAENGGPAINMVPKSGGNRFNGSAFYSGAGDWATSNNLDDHLRSIGIAQPPTLRSNWDASGSIGGPIKKDQLWFYGQLRQWATANVVDGISANQYAGDPTHWDYAPVDAKTLEARNVDGRKIYSIRLTGQATQKNRVTFYEEYQKRCSGSTLTPGGDGCRTAGAGWVGQGRSFGADTGAPESWPGYHNFPYNVTQLTWTSPISSRTLLEAGFSRFHYGFARFGQAPPDGLVDFIPVTEQSNVYGRTNLTYRGIFDPLDFAYNDNEATPYTWRAAMSYVTGAHNFKAGYQGNYFISHAGRVANTTQMRYTFNANLAASPATASSCTVSNGRNLCPSAVSYYLAPRWDQHDRTQTLGLYAQDQWTRGRLSVQAAVRYDRASSWSPADGNGTTQTSRFNKQTYTFGKTVSVSGYNDITPRLGAAYDLFGTGKTALKVNLGKYVQAATADVIYTANSPAARIVTRIGVPATPRGWTDGNHNFVVDCDLLNPALQDNLATGGDLCAALGGNNLNFGNANPNTTTVNPDILGGWGVRPYDWQFGASVQHELVPRVSIEAGYNRRWWGNFFVTDNTLTTAADYEVYGITIPQHDNLPGAGSTAQYVAITAAANARGSQNYMTAETDYGKARTSYWQGVDFTATARLTNGVTLQGGTSTGRGVRDNCEITKALPELLLTARVDSCHVTEKLATSFRGLASYTIPKIDVLVSSSIRSLVTAPGGGVATNGASLAANYVVPNTVIQQSLGRLPANALATGTTTVNLLLPGQLYTLERMNLVDMRFAKIVRFGGRRADVGVDLYNLFNTNFATAYQQTYQYQGNGADWLNPTSIVAPRLARFHVTLNF